MNNKWLVGVFYLLSASACGDPFTAADEGIDSGSHDAPPSIPLPHQEGGVKDADLSDAGLTPCGYTSGRFACAPGVVCENAEAKICLQWELDGSPQGQCELAPGRCASCDFHSCTCLATVYSCPPGKTFSCTQGAEGQLTIDCR